MGGRNGGLGHGFGLKLGAKHLVYKLRILATDYERPPAMSDHHHARKEEYQRAFSAFDDLKLEEKAFFLVDAAMTTVARALESAGRALSRELDNLAQTVVEAEEAVEEEVADAAEAAAEATPPPPKKKTTTRKKTTTKKTTAKKKTSPRTRTTKPKPDTDA